MIVSYVLITVLCRAFSIGFPQHRNSDDSELIFNLKNDADEYDSFENDGEPLLQPSKFIQENTRRKSGNISLEDIFSPQKLSWSLPCNENCPTVYRPKARIEDSPIRQSDDDILLHLSADKDLKKFLDWTMANLVPLNRYNASGSYFTNLDASIWRKAKGRREQPLYVEEPQYIVVRREPDDLVKHLKMNADIPFIPPRGRKYMKTMKDLEAILRRDDLFVPHRGKKNKLKEIFKYEDLFYPHRGKKRTSDHYFSQSTKNLQKTRLQPFDDCFTRCDDTTTIPSQPSTLSTNLDENINGLVSASMLNLPTLPWQVSSLPLDANTDGHQDASGCNIVADCQKENDVKINGFDQSVKAQIHQRQHSKEGALITTNAVAAANAYTDSKRDRRRLLSSSSSVEGTDVGGASSFSPLIHSDQIYRLQKYPIRNKQWRDYYFQKMAALSSRFDSPILKCIIS